MGQDSIGALRSGALREIQPERTPPGELKFAICRTPTPEPATDAVAIMVPDFPATANGNYCLTFPQYLGVVADLSRVPRQLVKAMQSIEITDRKEAWRARLAQLQGHKASLRLNGSTVTGLVRSVREDVSSTPRRWIVTVVGKEAVAA